MVLAEVLPERRARLTQLLEEVSSDTIAAMRGSPRKDALVPFQQLYGVHYARLVLFEHAGLGPMLAFATDYDGPEGQPDCSEREAFEQHLCELGKLARGLDQVFACCKGHRAGQLTQFLRDRRVRSRTFYVGAPGRSCQQILWEAQLAARVKLLAAERALSAGSPEQRRDAIRDQLRHQGLTLPAFPAQPDLTGRFDRVMRRAKLGLLLGAAELAALLALAFSWPLWAALICSVLVLASCAGLAVLHLRWLERTDPQFQPQLSAAAHAADEAAAQGENLFFQNQLTHLVPIKPGLLRGLLIRAVFVVLQLRATYVYNRGKLGDIPSIHFARWALIPRRGVLFFSNFDSSWQSYLGDFIDKASAGLTAVWSNTVGYPRTRWLLRAGSRDAARFLAWTRQHQLPSQVWYSAYPQLSIVAVNANTELRRGLAAPACMDASTWWLRVQGVDRLAADRQYSEAQTQAPALPLERIQGLILRGYGHMPEARYLMLRVSPERRADALAFIGSLQLTSAASGRRAQDAPEPLLNLAFSVHGLRALGVEENLCQSFATPFVQGSDHPQRARINGDVGDNDPVHWVWGAGDNVVHMILLVFGKTRQSVEQHAAQLRARAEQHGVHCIACLQGTTLPGRKEHFGFRDGIGQPAVQGCGEGDESRALPAGEFLLGHGDGYGNLAHAPQASNGLSFGHDGSYLVFRQLAQDVEGFWQHCAAVGGNGPASAVSAAARIVGRWPSGASLVVHPEEDPQDERFADEDDFSYLSNDEENDRYGARCPFSAHIRRANPRDWNLGATREESSQLSSLHRIIRRGRPYGAPLDPELSPAHMLTRARRGHGPAERGLQFLCFNANIERQFEFIQQHWCNNPSFAGLSESPDCLLSGAGSMQRFVQVLGSGYFFMPSLTAVELLSRGFFAPGPQLDFEHRPADEEQYVDSLIARLRDKMKDDYQQDLMRRDAHPKQHGCVKATFTTLQVPAELRAGLFREPRSHEAWVRFSNQSGRAAVDAKADVRGMAIKVLGVPGPKLLDGQEQCDNHDFVLISHDTFVTRNVQEFAGLIRAMQRGKLAFLRYVLARPHVRRYLTRHFKRHESLLDITYFSATPYLLGKRAVRYQLRPTAPLPASTFEGAEAGRDFLRARMKERLTQGSVTFDFMVQVAHAHARIDVEDPSVPWPEEQTSTYTLAKLEIAAQEFDTEARHAFGENLSFNPWRCLPEHRPLGGVNRARRQVYRALSQFRHSRNAAPSLEPVPERPPRGENP